jgi:hypothetical protein
VGQGHADGRLLSLVQGQVVLAGQVVEDAVEVRALVEGQAALFHAEDRPEAVGRAHLAVVEGGEVDGPVLVEGLRPRLAGGLVVGEGLDVDLLFGRQALDALGHQVRRHIEDAGALVDELALGGVDVAVVGHLAEGVGDAGLDSLGAVVGQAQLAGDLVGGEKADAVDVAGQAVGVVAHDVDAGIAVGLEDAHGVGGADVVALQEEHDLLDGLLLLPGPLDDGGAVHAHAQDLAQAPRLLLDDAQGVQLEAAHDAPGGHRADALDQARAKVFFDAGGGGGQDGGVALDLELAAVAGVAGPAAMEAQVFAGADVQEVADHGHGIGAALGRELGHGVAILLVIVGDPFDGADQGFRHRASRVGSRPTWIRVAGLRARGHYSRGEADRQG